MVKPIKPELPYCTCPISTPLVHRADVANKTGKAYREKGAVGVYVFDVGNSKGGSAAAGAVAAGGSCSAAAAALPEATYPQPGVIATGVIQRNRHSFC